jgi:hypothetical protein
LERNQKYNGQRSPRKSTRKAQNDKQEKDKDAVKESNKLEEIDSEQKKCLKKACDIYEKHQSSKYEISGCSLFAQKVDQYVITKLKRKGKWKKFRGGDNTSLRCK